MHVEPLRDMATADAPSQAVQLRKDSEPAATSQLTLLTLALLMSSLSSAHTIKPFAATGFSEPRQQGGRRAGSKWKCA